jgi:hypothetical protein
MKDACWRLRRRICDNFRPPGRFRSRQDFRSMAKPHRKLKKANHGARPASAKARKAKRKHIKT